MKKDKTSSAQDKLEQVYFQFLEEKHYSKITVAELIEKAGVSRMTFYRNYEDIFDMHKKVCKHLLCSLVEPFLEILQLNKDVIDSQMEEFCVKLNSQKKYISLLIGDNADKFFFEAGVSIILDLGNKYLNVTDDEQSYALRFIALSSITTYFYSLISGKNYSPEYIEIYKNIFNYAQKAEEQSNVQNT